jgi:hypothetical protein
MPPAIFHVCFSGYTQALHTPTNKLASRRASALQFIFSLRLEPLFPQLLPRPLLHPTLKTIDRSQDSGATDIMSNSAPTTFHRYNDLPLDIKLMLFEDILVKKNPINPRMHKVYCANWLNSLSRVNKEFHTLSIEMYYGKNTFVAQNTPFTGATTPPSKPAPFRPASSRGIQPGDTDTHTRATKIFAYPNPAIGKHVRRIIVKLDLSLTDIATRDRPTQAALTLDHLLESQWDWRHLLSPTASHVPLSVLDLTAIRNAVYGSRNHVGDSARFYQRDLCTRWRDAFPHLRRLTLDVTVHDWCESPADLAAQLSILFRDVEIRAKAEEVVLEVRGVRCGNQSPGPGSNGVNLMHALDEMCVARHEGAVCEAIRSLITRAAAGVATAAGSS